MEPQSTGSDTSSIEPLSSLRSKFEGLSRERDGTAALPRTSREGSMPLRKERSALDPKTGINVEGRLDEGLSGTGLRKLRPDRPTSRPVSMISISPSKHSPPKLTIDGPSSPHKAVSIDLRPSHANSPLRMLTPEQKSDSPTTSNGNGVSRATSPGLEARMTALLQSSEILKAQSHDDLATDARHDLRPKPAPPAVNRASKPKIPLKPASLVQKSTGLMPPQPDVDLTDQSNSPFGTPPSSKESSPERKPFPASGLYQHFQVGAHDVATKRARNDSDASWVQRIRGDSDASYAERDRAGSNASFVETSDVADVWMRPPVHHAVAARREQQTTGMARPFAMLTHQSTQQDRHNAGDQDWLGDHPPLTTQPELRARGRASPTKAASRRDSPTRVQASSRLRSGEGLRRANTDLEPATAQRTLPTNPVAKSALNQGFDRTRAASDTPVSPAPRRSVDRRREPPPPPTTRAGTADVSHDEDQNLTLPDAVNEKAQGASDFPDSTTANRRPPRFKQRPYHIPTDYDTKLFAVCGDYVCTTGWITKAWNLRTGGQLLNLEHRESTRVTSIVFKPSPNIEDEGKRIWLGTSGGEIHEVDIVSQRLVKTRSTAHTRREIVRMFRYASELWTLDDGGDLNIWKPDHKGMPSLDSQCTNWRVPRGHSFSIAAGNQLWMASGKDIRVFLPCARSDTEFQVLRSPLCQSSAGDITTGATLDSKQDLIYFGHSDGKVSVYNRRNFTCAAVLTASTYKIISLSGVGDYLWAGFSTGMAYVFDPSTTPWTVKKDWQAHDKQICSIVADPSAIWKMGRLNVVTLGVDNMLKVWDGMLENDWLDAQMDKHDSEYCSFRELTAAVMTWNAGAAKPSQLSYNKQDDSFFREYLSVYPDQPPDIFVFGFQEVVDLEDKKVISKSLFRSKKKDPAEQEHTSHVYRAWRDYLARYLDECLPGGHTYTLVSTSSMVGLFTCVFVKSSQRKRIRHVHTAEIKRGMGGSLGNKGALVVRMILDDSSICFTNCHLAAGQTQTVNRNNDVAAILEATSLPSYPLQPKEIAQHADVFTSGGDGSMILDHEICILNGDLNYRIDTMGRDTVVKHVASNNLPRLLERDQLLLSKKRNPGFRLRAFQENPITFAPTYKYNPGTDDYDSSEKKRSPAWCDRILYRGRGKVMMEEYRRWDGIRVSDHRPVSGRLRFRVKRVDEGRRAVVWERCQDEFESVRARIKKAAQLEYLTNVLGMRHKEAAAALKH